ncbi:hypothetical protein Nepgr_024771 [Nepenthes gracilis]|uniref:Uncharacterized protein n=1 Tax=Nepenthes gracilis TaxID=150966 RepID=A0AAD3T4V5_NEPGR|nr:hypothetical protein Nepgr_024771 [Nepenthes gracilis]
MVGIGLSFWPGLYALSYVPVAVLSSVGADEAADDVASLLDESLCLGVLLLTDYTVVGIVGLLWGSLGLQNDGLSNPVPYESPHSEDHVEADCRASLPPIDSNGIAGHLQDSVIADGLPQPEPITNPIIVLTADSDSAAVIENPALLIADSLALTSPNYPYPVSVPNEDVLDEPGPSNIGLVYPTKFFTRSPVLDPPSCELESTYHHLSDDVGGGDCKSPNGAILDSKSTPGQPVPLLPDSIISELPALAPSFVEFGSHTCLADVLGLLVLILGCVDGGWQILPNCGRCCFATILLLWLMCLRRLISLAEVS